MRVFVTGASGAIGTRLVTRLIDDGHEVTGTFRSPASARKLGDLGA
jgi:nucleoside-diphosphate-sugar epimerase